MAKNDQIEKAVAEKLLAATQRDLSPEESRALKVQVETIRELNK
jgi:hypothetical protein